MNLYSLVLGKYSMYSSNIRVFPPNRFTTTLMTYSTSTYFNSMDINMLKQSAFKRKLLIFFLTLRVVDERKGKVTFTENRVEEIPPKNNLFGKK